MKSQCRYGSAFATALIALGVFSPAMPVLATPLPGVSSGTQVVHYDANVGVTSSSGTVTAWADQSGNGFNATNAEGSPTLVAGVINGKPAIHFDASNGTDAFSLPSSIGTFLGSDTQFTLFAVTKNTVQSAVADGDELDGLITTNQGNAQTFRTRFNAINLPGDGGPPLAAAPTGSLVTVRFSLADDPGTVSPVAVRHLETFINSTTESKSVDSWFSPGGSTNQISFSVITLGRADGLGFTGDLAEFVIYKGALSNADMNSVRTALSQSFALAVPVPEPVSGAMLGLAGLLLLRRQRAPRTRA